MSRRYLKLFIRFLVITTTLSLCYSMKILIADHQQKFSLLIDFTCAVVKDELEKHPEMQTIAMIELENNFPSDFSAKVLKCLPDDVAKIIINPHTHVWSNQTLKFSKETFVIYTADNVDYWKDSFFRWRFDFEKNFFVVSHLSKHLIVSSDETKINRTEIIFGELLNVIQIYEKDRKVIARSFDRTKKLANFETFQSSQRENLFSDKVKDLNGEMIFAVWDGDSDTLSSEVSDKPHNKWTFYLDIIAEKLKATISYSEIQLDDTNLINYVRSKQHLMGKLMDRGRLDFYLNYGSKSDLESYNNDNWCLIAPLPKPYSITELILFMPMDESCWMWLGITIAVSTLVWRISESHWGFAFGFFSYFMGQAQLIIRIRTNRLTMKILLQLLIFAIFIFSNGYQSLVTSFMLNPMQQKRLRSIDEVFDSDLKIKEDWNFEEVYADNPKYQKAEQDDRIVDFDFERTNWTKEMIEKNLAHSQPCKTIKMSIELRGDGKSWNGNYLINEVAYTVPNGLYTAPFHPLLEIFQELMDRSFEAGLHQAWERFFWDAWREGEKRENPKEEKEILDFGLIAPSLYILAFGLPFALFVLFCEIFWKDFVMKLSKEYFERKLKEIFRREIKVEKKMPKVRRIHLKPELKRRNTL